MLNKHSLSIPAHSLLFSFCLPGSEISFWIILGIALVNVWSYRSCQTWLSSPRILKPSFYSIFFEHPCCSGKASSEVVGAMYIGLPGNDACSSGNSWLQEAQLDSVCSLCFSSAKDFQFAMEKFHILSFLNAGSTAFWTSLVEPHSCHQILYLGSIWLRETLWDLKCSI